MTDIRTLSNSAVAMAFGMAVQSKPGTTPPGALCRLADELKRRGLYVELMNHLAENHRGAVNMQIAVDRSRTRGTGGARNVSYTMRRP